MMVNESQEEREKRRESLPSVISRFSFSPSTQSQIGGRNRDEKPFLSGLSSSISMNFAKQSILERGRDKLRPRRKREAVLDKRKDQEEILHRVTHSGERERVESANEANDQMRIRPPDGQAAIGIDLGTSSSLVAVWTSVT